MKCARWGGDSEAVSTRLKQLLEVTDDETTMTKCGAVCRFEIFDIPGAGSFRKPIRRLNATVAVPPAAALDRWQIHVLTHRGWEDLGVKLLGRPEIFGLFREIERSLVNPCDPALWEDGSAVLEVDTRHPSPVSANLYPLKPYISFPAQSRVDAGVPPGHDMGDPSL
jgi:hypothetical protein